MQQCWLFLVGMTTPGGDLSNGKIAGIVVGVVVWLYYLVLGVAFMIAGPTIRSANVKCGPCLGLDYLVSIPEWPVLEHRLLPGEDGN
jgi:multisubunit Na+/H+ antiporter MnhB subunit